MTDIWFWILFTVSEGNPLIMSEIAENINALEVVLAYCATTYQNSYEIK